MSTNKQAFKEIDTILPLPPERSNRKFLWFFLIFISLGALVFLIYPRQDEQKYSSFSSSLYFDFNSADLNTSAMASVRDTFNKIKAKKGRLILEGHTFDGTGQLSNKRVKNVEKAFRDLGLSMNIRMFLFFYNKSRSFSTDETLEGISQNPRVDIHFIPDK
jgi:outer membrane protein OmpA-like peptidoglycan-associated protein